MTFSSTSNKKNIFHFYSVILFLIIPIIYVFIVFLDIFDLDLLNYKKIRLLEQKIIEQQPVILSTEETLDTNQNAYFIGIFISVCIIGGVYYYFNGGNTGDSIIVDSLNVCHEQVKNCSENLGSIHANLIQNNATTLRVEENSNNLIIGLVNEISTQIDDRINTLFKTVSKEIIPKLNYIFSKDGGTTSNLNSFTQSDLQFTIYNLIVSFKKDHQI